MRRVLMAVSMFLAVAGLGWSQALTEGAGAIAGGSIGGVAGKKVSDGITTVLGKVDAVARKAAKTEKAPEAGIEKAKTGNSNGSTVLQVGPSSVVKDHSLVPPPPPARRVAAVVPEPPSEPSKPRATIQRIAVLAPPPPPQVTRDDLKALSSGTARADVLKLGAPASRITMYDDGHLVEIYRYQTRDTMVGVVHLSDGSVSSVQVR
jgi:hypothetical protein